MLSVALSVVAFVVVRAFGNDDILAKVNVWLTSSDLLTGNPLKLLQPQPAIHEIPLSVEQKAENSQIIDININSSVKYQSIVGYGAGLPQSSAFVLIDLKKKDRKLYDGVMRKIFGNGEGEASVSALRFPVGSCDFSIHNTSYDEHYNDFSLDWFALDPDTEYIVEVLQDAKSINSKITLMATPWSAPSWMKTWNTLIAESESNTLLDSDQVYNSYAQYFAKFVKVFADKGLDLSYVTLQNEPLFGTSVEYPGMYFTAEQATRLAKLVRKVLPSHVGILAYDHNWDRPDYPMTVLANAPETVAGVAWHCYGGDMSTALDEIQSKYPYPSYPQHITECTGGYPDSSCDLSQGLAGFGYNHEWDMNNLFLGASSHYAVSGIKWIIALDENCGPVLPLVSWRWGRPVISIPSTAKTMDDIKLNQDYWTISHMSRFVPPQSHRVQSAIASNSDKNTEISSETFIDTATNLMTTLVMNSDKAQSRQLSITQGKTRFTYSLAPFSTVVFQWSL